MLGSKASARMRKRPSNTGEVMALRAAVGGAAGVQHGQSSVIDARAGTQLD